MHSNDLCFLDLITAEGSVRVPLSSIISVEDAGSFRLILTDNGSYKERRELHVLKKLLPEDFLLSDLRHLTNMNRILKPTDGAFIMDSGALTPVEPFLEEHTRLQFYRWAARRCWESESDL